MELDTIVVGDCLDVMADMPDGCVDLVVTDPPYGILKKEFDWDRVDVTFHHKWVEACVRLLKEGGSFYSFFSQLHIPLIQPVLCEKLTLRNVMVWHYRNNVGGYHGFLSGKHCYIKRWQPIFFLSKGKPKISPRTNWKRYAQTNYDVIVEAAPQSTFRDKKVHPTQKPLRVMERLIKASSDVGDLVFDPFMGSGTTAVAAIKMDRHFYGCDSSEEYVKLANKRIKKARLEMAQLEMILE